MKGTVLKTMPDVDDRALEDAALYSRLPAEMLRIPDRLNAAIIAVQLVLIFLCFWAASVISSLGGAGRPGRRIRGLDGRGLQRYPRIRARNTL